MQDLIEVAIDGRGMRRDADREGEREADRVGEREVQREGVARGGRSVTVNRAESPLTWLRSRGLIDARQYAAGERLRAAYETASIAPSVTMRWTPRVDGGGQDALDRTVAQIAAKRRFDAAIDSFLEEERPFMELGRRGEPDEVASVITFLCSDRAAFVNGSTYRVDAGSVATI